jgi:Amt family ammonium transporter
VMLLGWSIYGVGNASAAMSRVFAAAAGATAGMLWSQLRYGKQDITLVLLALWGGLIASSAGQINHPFWAVLIGGSGGIVVIVVMFLIDLSMRIDDPTSVVAVHGAGALWGAMIGSIARDLPWADRLGQLGLAALASVVFLTLGFLLTWLAAIVLKRTTRLKVHEADQFEGLDLVEHDLNAYPDFQQTMIKSYHMREA